MIHQQKYSLMRTMIQYTGKVLSAGLLLIGILCGCAQTEIENRFSESGDDGVGKPVAFSIGVVDAPEYNVETDGTPDTRSGKPLLDEWVKVNSSNATRSAEAYEGPNIATIQLVEDTASCTPQTRGMMGNGYYFRLIAFKKSGADYVYHAAADYVIKGMNAPELIQGTMELTTAATYRFLAYSFNNDKAMGDIPLGGYTWNSTAVSIPDLNSDFLTFDSGDQQLSSESFFLPVRFIHQLCRLTVKISVTGFDSNTFTNCTGVYIKGGGNSSSWTVGASEIGSNTGDTPTFNIEDNSSNTTRLVPFAEGRPITVHFGTLTVGGKALDNKEITSSQKVRLLAGKSYTMTVQFEKVYELTEPTNGYVQIGKCKWAYANLKANHTMESNPWESGQQRSDGTKANDYWRWNMVDIDEDSTTPSNPPDTWAISSDPCRQVQGGSWKVPTKEDFDDLTGYKLVFGKVRINGANIATNKYGWVSSEKVAGCVFVDKIRGTCIFLPAAGSRKGSSYSSVGRMGYYWSATLYTSNASGYAYSLNSYSESCNVSSTPRESGRSLRCVHE